MLAVGSFPKGASVKKFIKDAKPGEIPHFLLVEQCADDHPDKIGIAESVGVHERFVPVLLHNKERTE